MNDTADAPPPATPEPTNLRHRLRRPLFALGIVVVAIGSGYFYLRGQRYASTDNAYVKATVVMISPEVTGKVAQIAVHENQSVKAGEVLVQLRERPYQIALAQAAASLDNTARQIEALRATYGQRRADLSQAEVDINYYQREFTRQQDLVVRGFTSRTTYDEAQHKLAAARKGADAVVQSMHQVSAILSGDPTTPLDHIPMYLQSRAQVDQAQLNLDHTTLKAPMDGMVARVPEIGPGDVVNSGQALFSLVDIEHPWIEANLKETDLTYVHIGQPAQVRVDSYPDQVWHARVQSISPATGSEFSMLPPENASGNWVKVVQRVKVRLTLDPHEHEEPLRAGLSVNVRIDTGRFANWLPG